VDVGRATSVTWRVFVGGKRVYNDEVVFDRPRIVGAGAFIVPVLPVALVYDPPSGNGVTSSQTYTLEHSVGTSVRMEFAQENSTTVPGSPSQFSTVGALSSKATGLGEVFDSAAGVSGNDTAGKIAAGLKAIGKLLGSATANNTIDEIRTEVSESQLKLTLKTVDTPNSKLGPGKGDVVAVLINARLVWLVADGELTLTLLGYDKPQRWDVETLRTNPEVFKVDAATAQELLKLDPFVAGGPNAALPGPRFTIAGVGGDLGIIGLSNDTHTFELSSQISQTDLSTTAGFQSRTEDFRAGWLSFLGVGVDVTKQVTSKMSYSNSRSVEVGTTTTAAVTLDVVGFAEFDVRYDVIFGTFALKRR
jgi:hypothetical protein